MSSKTASVCLLVAVAISTVSATIPIPEIALTVPSIGIGLPTLPTAAAASAAAPAISISLPTSLPALALPNLGGSLPALPALTAVGGTTLVASGGNVALAAASIAGLAIAKEALILATLHDRRNKRPAASVSAGVRHKRQAVESVDFSKVFDRIAEQDVADCGKLLVCQSFAKTDGQRTGEEKAVVNLFDDLSAIQNNAFGTYQWAAYSGSFKNPVICIERYGQCPVEQSILANLIAPQ